MDVNKLSKPELLALVVSQQEELKKLNAIDLKATIDLKNDAIRNEHSLRQENKKLLEKLQQLEEEKENEIKANKKEKEYVIIKHEEEIQSNILKYEEQLQSNLLKYEEEIQSIQQALQVAQTNLESSITLKNDAVRNEHELRKENNVLQNQVRSAEDNNKHVVKKINELAGILEEYVTTFEEQQKIFAIVLKNNNYIQSALKQKIETFNKGE
jgi:hypothetical protein